MTSFPLGGASLAGIGFTLKNASASSVHIPRGKGGKEYEVGDVIPDPDGNLVFTTDENGKISAPSDYLPYGTYTLTETKSNESYLLTDGEPHTFRIREEGVIVGATEDGMIRSRSEAEEAGLVAADQAVRADISFQKKDENGRNMSFIPFVITSQATGETHYILTDANDEYWSQSKGMDTGSNQWTPHTLNTNANDAVLACGGDHPAGSD